MPQKKYRRLISSSAALSLFGAFIFWLLAPYYADSQDKPTSFIKEEKPAQTLTGIASVTDGDTIKIGKEKIRLEGIDAPEIKQKCRDENNRDYLCGEAASHFLKGLAEGKKVHCNYQERDIYHRILGICFLDQTNLNDEMLRSGMAIIYDFENADIPARKLEAEAREAKKGVWRGPFLEPKQYRKKMRQKEKRGV